MPFDEKSGAGAWGALASLQMNFEVADMTPEYELNEIVWKSVRGSRDIEHVGSAHSPAEVEMLKASAVQRIAAGQDPLPLDQPVDDGPRIQVVGMRMGLLLDAIAQVYRWLGLDKASGGDLVFEHLVTARIIDRTV